MGTQTIKRHRRTKEREIATPLRPIDAINLLRSAFAQEGSMPWFAVRYPHVWERDADTSEEPKGPFLVVSAYDRGTLDRAEEILGRAE